MLVGFARAQDTWSLLREYPLAILCLSTSSRLGGLYNIPETPNSKQKAKEMMGWMSGCSHGVTSQLLEVHGCAKCM